MKRLVILCTAALMAGTSISLLSAADDKPKMTIKEVMKLHKDKLHEKFEKGEASKEEKTKLQEAWLGKSDPIAAPLATQATSSERKAGDVLTPETVNAWRNAYVAKAGSDPMKRKSAERSAASCMRCARSLFTADILPALKVKLPPNPFAGVKLKDPGAQRYHSEVSAEWLLTCAERELRSDHPQQYLALFLCIWAGLRRKEADLLTWEQIDFRK